MVKRIVFVDFLRGLAIFYMIILHAFLYRVVNQYKPLFGVIMTTSPIIARIVAAPFIFFSLWGSIFSMFAGIVFFYRVRVDSNSIENFSPCRYFLRRGLSGTALIITHYIWLVLFSPKSIEHPGIPTYSLITGTIENLKFSPLNVMHFSTTGLIESLGWILIIFSILGYFVFHHKKAQTKKFTVYFSSALLVSIVITILLDILIGDPYIFFKILYDNHRIAAVIFFGKISCNRFSLFPLVIFALCGAFIGYFLGRSTNEKNLVGVLIGIGSICILGFIIYLILGFNMLEAYISSYIPLPLHLLNLGSELVFIIMFYLIFKKYQAKVREKDVGIIRYFQMYSNSSLTVYLFEPFISILLFQLVQYLYKQPISENFFVWTGFLVLNALLWLIILLIWRKFDHKFSVEWIVSKINRKKENTSTRFSQ